MVYIQFGIFGYQILSDLVFLIPTSKCAVNPELETFWFFWQSEHQKGIVTLHGFNIGFPTSKCARNQGLETFWCFS